MYRRAFSFLGFVLWLSSAVAVEPDLYPAPSPNSADKPLAKALSLEKAGTFLDRAVFAWTREQKAILLLVAHDPSALPAEFAGVARQPRVPLKEGGADRDDARLLQRLTALTGS